MAMTNTDILIEKKDDCLTINLPKRLDTNTVAPIWEMATHERDQCKPKHLLINAANTVFCDGAGIALLTELSKRQAQDKHSCQINGLQEDFHQLLKNLEQVDTERPTPTQKPSFIKSTGIKAIAFLDDCKENCYFIGEFSVQLSRQLFHLRDFRWKSFWKHIETIGPKALPIGALLGFIMGLILSFQGLTSLRHFGATLYTVNLVGVSLTRELGALLTGVIIAGRTASSFAAEIGTMKINQEIDALVTMGIKPMHYLVLPRVAAGILMTPLLAIYLVLFGFLGCYLVMNAEGFSLQMFISQLASAVTLGDIWEGLLKALIFGVLITCIGCIHGMKTKNHAVAVGESTTRAVVSSIVMLAVADGILTLLAYML